MRKTILSTADVARLFNVTETTVKRWANDGTLKCMKTPGGHRKFEMKHVVEFAQKLNFEPVGTLEWGEADASANKMQVAILERDFTALSNAYVGRALSRDKHDVAVLFSYLYKHRIHLWEIYDLVIRPGMMQIGQRWADGELDIAQEHSASHQTMDALAKLQLEVYMKPSNGFDVVCACPGEEQHEIGLRCASYLFESEGWTSHYLGARTPHVSIINTVKEIKPSAVCLSVTHLPEDDGIIEGMAKLLRTLREMDVKILYGGRIPCSVVRDSLGNETVYCSALDVLNFIHRFELEQHSETPRRSQEQKPE